MKKISLLALLLIMLTMACTKEVSKPEKKKDYYERKRSRNPALPPTPY